MYQYLSDTEKICNYGHWEKYFVRSGRNLQNLNISVL